MPTTCQFYLNRAVPIYYSGEQISGKVFLTTTKKLNLKDIFIELKGFINVKWSEPSKPTSVEHNDSNDCDNIICYQGKQNLLKQIIKFDENIALNRYSKYTRDFEFTIPSEVPATCKHKYGEISYELNLILKRKSKFNKIFHERIVIRNESDLNMHGKLNEPKTAFGDGLSFTIPRSGYVPGQIVDFELKFTKLRIENRIIVNLCEKTTCRSLSPTVKVKENVRVLNSITMEKTGLCSHKLNMGRVCVPLTISVSNQKLDDLVQVSYYLEAIVLNSKRMVLQKLVLPIIIGTIPLEYEVKEQFNSAHFCYDNLATISESKNLNNELGELEIIPKQYVLDKKCTKDGVSDDNIVTIFSESSYTNRLLKYIV
ncbi:arrestin domain-containing protein 3 isoform X2 [Teleopsis dalmanni]|uniref:arrestin domain-containing protein 3 isoform X2 n=1 Tax=Teleopsis dalmanni TaxID=139649 RepID=UPI0018CE2FB9|nr:arrestin domain-containing protein 3 isoform X2 [Teleopsis dalmanni]